MKVIVLHNQTLFDVCLQQTGSILGVVEFAKKNGISITDELIPGQEIEMLNLENDMIDKDILSYYKANNIQPATAVRLENESTKKAGGFPYGLPTSLG